MFAKLIVLFCYSTYIYIFLVEAVLVRIAIEAHFSLRTKSSVVS